MLAAPYLDDVVIGWQEKLFRAAELRYYSGKREEDFANDVLRKKFYHDAKVHSGINLISVSTSKAGPKSLLKEGFPLTYDVHE